MADNAFPMGQQVATHNHEQGTMTFFNLKDCRANEDGRWSRQRRLLYRAKRRHPDQLKPHVVEGVLRGYHLPEDLYYSLDKPVVKSLALTKFNVARALYVINKLAKIDGHYSTLYDLKDKVLAKAIADGWAKVVEYHSMDHEPPDDDCAVRRYYELIEFSVFTFHRPVAPKPEHEVKHIADWKPSREITKTKPLTRSRATELLKRYLNLVLN